MADVASLDRIDIATLVPHQGAMCLWQRVLGFDAASVRVITTSHLDALNPLRSDGVLRAIHICEYGAQAMAVQLLSDDPERAGRHLQRWLGNREELLKA